jgi:hypothetical protein
VTSSAIDDGHVSCVVARAGGRREVIQPFDLLGAQLDAVRGGVLFYAGNPLGAGIGAMSSPCASSRASAIWAGVAPTSRATARTSSTMRRLRWKFSPVKRGLVLRQSSSESCSGERISPVRKPWPSAISHRYSGPDCGFLRDSFVKILLMTMIHGAWH